MSNLFSADDAGSATAWNAPEVAGPLAHKRRNWRTVDELEGIERAAWEESYAEGLAAGQAAGLAEVRKRVTQLDAQIAHFDEIVSLLARPLSRMDIEVETQLVNLAVSIARQLLRRELKLDPSQVVAAVRETVALLPAAAREVRVRLHPDDAALVREKLATPQAEQAWRIVEDPVLARGDCRVSAEAAQIDARLESRLAAVISTVLGDERDTERGDGRGESGDTEPRA
ncbi:MAG: flagellar assembly protein FliH [Steroidobacteraceae bacterium]